MNTSLHRRCHTLTSDFSDAKIDALLITSPANWFYLTGFTGESGALVVSRKGTTLITDGRFMVQGRAETSGVRIFQQKGSLFESVGRLLKDWKSRRAGLDPTQVTVGQLQSIRKAAGASVQWVPTLGKVESLRMRKSLAEFAQSGRGACLGGEGYRPPMRVLEIGARSLDIETKCADHV